MPDLPEFYVNRYDEKTHGKAASALTERECAGGIPFSALRFASAPTCYAVTSAAVHDSQVFDELLDSGTDANGNKRAVYADSAYRSEAQEQRLAAAEIGSQICEKGTRGKPFNEAQKQANRTKSKVRARVEHVFAGQAN